jgi:protein O-mannosyl-transferase
MSSKLNINPGKQQFIVYALLILATFIVFWQVNQYDFINYDDPIYVTANNHILSGITLDGIRWAFSARYLEFWHPLLWLSFMADYQLYGLNAGGYHLTNLILHVLSTLLLFWLFNRMTGALWKSAFIAAFFALHPLHVESVAWVSERKDVLSALFWMLTLCLYVYYTEKPVIQRYWLVVFSFICALMSKPMVVTLPVIMILLDYWPLNRFESKKDHLILWQLKEKLPFFILSAVFIIIMFFIPNPDAPISAASFPLSCRLANAPISFVTYMGKIFWPADMAVFYPFFGKHPCWQIFGSVLLIILISAAVTILMRRFPYLFCGWLWYAIALLPVIGLTQLKSFAMADRYTYLPSIGISIMMAWGIQSLIKSDEGRKKILFPVSIIVLFILMLLAWKQCGYWKDNIMLWNHALKVTNDNYVAHSNLGSDLLEKGNIKEAIDHYNKAVSIAPYYEIIHYNRGIASYNLGQKKRALEDFKEAIRIKPDYAAAYYNMGIIYLDLGEYQNAIENYGQAIHINPDYAYAYNDRALASLNMGNNEQGCLDAQKACALGVCKVLEWAKSKKYCH